VEPHNALFIAAILIPIERYIPMDITNAVEIACFVFACLLTLACFETKKNYLKGNQPCFLLLQTQQLNTA